MVMSSRAFGSPAKGKMAPERKKRGMTIKFMISWKPCMSDRTEAIAVPKAVNKIAMSRMKMKAVKIGVIEASLKPAIKEIIKTKKPWQTEMVAPPKVRPIMMFILETGATRVSFKKPNCLSQIISMPEKIAENKTLMAIMPGARN